MEISFFRLIFQGIPENIAVATLAFVIAKARIDWKRIVLIGIILAFTAYVVRLIPITFGVHIIVNIGLLIFLLFHLGRADLTRSIISALIAFLSLILAETIANMAILSLFHLSIEEVMKNDFLMTAIGIPQVIILFFLAFLLKKYL